MLDQGLLLFWLWLLFLQSVDFGLQCEQLRRGGGASKTVTAPTSPPSPGED